MAPVPGRNSLLAHPLHRTFSTLPALARLRYVPARHAFASHRDVLCTRTRSSDRRRRYRLTSVTTWLCADQGVASGQAPSSHNPPGPTAHTSCGHCSLSQPSAVTAFEPAATRYQPLRRYYTPRLSTSHTRAPPSARAPQRRLHAPPQQIRAHRVVDMRHGDHTLGDSTSGAHRRMSPHAERLPT